MKQERNFWFWMWLIVAVGFWVLLLTGASAQQKSISQLDPATTLADGDLHEMVDLDGTPKSRKVTLAQLKAYYLAELSGWTFDTATAEADPGAGEIRFNHATPASVTEIYVNSASRDGRDWDLWFAGLRNGDKLALRVAHDQADSLMVSVTATLDNVGWWTLTVTIDDSGTLPAAGNNMLMTFGLFAKTPLLDEDNMASNSATAGATQQSIKAYVDTLFGAALQASNNLADVNDPAAAFTELTDGLTPPSSPFVGETDQQTVSNKRMKTISAVVDDHGGAVVGATETVNFDNGNIHVLRLDQNCTVTFSNWDTSGFRSTILVVYVQTGAGGWTVGYAGGSDPVDPDPTIDGTANALTEVAYWSDDGGTTIYARSSALSADDLPVMVGDSGSGGTAGAAPAPGAGDAAAGKFLKANGTWDVPSGSGSGDVVGPASAVDNRIATFDGATGKLIQDSGSLVSDFQPADADLTDLADGTLSAGAGGTGANTLTDGGVLLGSGTGAITPMAVLADGEMIVGDGTGDPVAESGATLRTSLGLGTGDSPTFNGLTLGGNLSSASDITLNAVGDDYFLGSASVSDPQRLHIFDGGADNEPGYIMFYDDAGNDYALWVSTAGALRFHTAAPTDDDADGTALGAGGGGLANVVEDTTPQLGGALDVNGQEIQSAAGFVFQLGSNDGSDSFVMQDSDSASVFDLDSNGLVTMASLDVTDAFTVGSIVFEGATADDFEATLAVTDPTADRTATFPDASGEVSLLGQTIGAAEIETDGVSADELNATGVESELEAVLDLNQMQGQIADAQIADGAVDGGTGGEIADASITAADLATDSVSADELNATGVEAELEAVMDLQDMQGAVTDGQVPDTITLSGNTVGTSDLTLAEGGEVVLDPAGSADGAFSGMTVAGTAGATLAFGDLIVLDVTDSRWELADANSAASADGDSRGMIGICVLAAASDGSATRVLLQGIVRADAAFPTLTVNNPVYISETAGDITQTSPTTEDNVVRNLGAAMTADEIYFDPDRIWVAYDAP